MVRKNRYERFKIMEITFVYLKIKLLYLQCNYDITNNGIKMEVTITNENFESYKNGELPLVVDFWATWCAPCRMIAPIIAELAEEYDGKVVVGKCDVEDADEIASEFGIRNIPTILFLKNGEVVDKFVGAASKAKIEEKFKSLL